MPLEKEKLVRQLSLVAFLMSMQRAVTARDVREHVEGYSHMGDDAFARRFYADRTELLGLGVPLNSNRDDDTGEELYTLSARNYLLPTLDLTDREVASIHSCLSLLDGQFAYAEPLRLALQNLTLGRENPMTDLAVASTEVRLTGSEYTPEIAARIAKLETAITKRRTITFSYFTMGRGEESERVVDPYSLVWNDGHWYLVGHSHERDDVRQFRLSRIQGEIKFTSRRERDFEVPASFDATDYRTRPTWQFGEPVGEADVWVDPAAAWLVERTFEHAGEVVERHEDGAITFRTGFHDLSWLTSWVLRWNGLVRPVAPAQLVSEIQDALEAIATQHTGAAPALASELPVFDVEELPRRRKPVAPVGAEQFALLQALMSDLLASCNSKGDGEMPAADLMERYGLDEKSLREAVDLLTLVNFGAGAYAMYAELDGDTVRVDAWPDGEVFRRPARLSPLEAKALMLALDLVGPLVAATGNSDLDSVRTKLTEAFGGYGAPTVPATSPTSSEQHVLERLTTAMREQRVLRLEYWSQGRGELSQRDVEPVLLQRLRQHWYAVAWCRKADSLRSFRLDRIKSLEVLDEVFAARDLDLSDYTADTPTPEVGTLEEAPRVVDLWFNPDAAGYEIENRSATRLVDGSATWHTATNGDTWLVEEILSYRGRAVVTGPTDLREQVASRARELRELVARVPVG